MPDPVRLSRRKVRGIAKRLRKRLGLAFGEHRAVDRDEIDRACRDAGITRTEEIAVAWILFGSSLPDNLGLLLDQTTLDMLDDLAGLGGDIGLMTDLIDGDDVF